MKKLTLNLAFFAEHMMAEENRLKYVIIVRKYNDPQIKNFYAPGILVDGISDKVYSLYDGCFIGLGKLSDSRVMTLSTTYIKQPNGDVLLVDNKSGNTIRYTYQDFIDVYGDRVINETLI